VYPPGDGRLVRSTACGFRFFSSTLLPLRVVSLNAVGKAIVLLCGTTFHRQVRR
jgi:hypothetical protein